MSRDHLKRILIGSRLVDAAHAEYAAAYARAEGLTWLEYLIIHGFLDEEVFATAISRACRVPRCDLQRLANLPKAVVAALPASLAVEHRMVPLWLEADGYLRVAMLDPTDLAAVEEVQFFTGKPILREIAGARAIAWALHAYYDAVVWRVAPVAVGQQQVAG